jgi:hypothetical protein
MATVKSAPVTAASKPLLIIQKQIANLKASGAYSSLVSKVTALVEEQLRKLDRRVPRQGGPLGAGVVEQSESRFRPPRGSPTPRRGAPPGAIGASSTILEEEFGALFRRLPFFPPSRGARSGVE